MLRPVHSSLRVAGQSHSPLLFRIEFSSIRLCFNGRGDCNCKPGARKRSIFFIVFALAYLTTNALSLFLGTIRIDVLNRQTRLWRTSTLIAHQNEVVHLTLNSDASFLASASEQGTLIRIFETNSLKQVREFRRGSDPANIYGLKFRSDSRMLLTSSDKGTIHWFTMDTDPASG